MMNYNIIPWIIKPLSLFSGLDWDLMWTDSRTNLWLMNAVMVVKYSGVAPIHRQEPQPMTIRRPQCAVELSDCANLALAEHTWGCHHPVDWCNTRVLEHHPVRD